MGSSSRFEYRTQARWAALIFGLAFAALAWRFFDLQIVRGDEYEKLSQIKQIGRARVRARRGEIRDRASRVLARNVPTHEAYLVPGRVRKPKATVALLADLLGLTHEEQEGILGAITGARGSDRWERVPIRRDLVGERCPLDNNRLELLHEEHEHYLCRSCGRRFEIWTRGRRRCFIDGGRLLVRGEGRLARCSRCGMEYLREPVCPYDGAKLVKRTYHLRCRVCGNRYNDEVAMVESRRDDLPGVVVTTDFRRDYPFGSLAAVPVGYVNEVNRKEVDAEPKVYRPSDVTGRRGIEKAMEHTLRGHNGEYLYLRRKGKKTITRADAPLIEALRGYKPRAAVPGHHVILTLDIEIQKVLEESLRRYRAGAAVVVRPGTGEILGLYSTPTYDPNHWSGRLTPAIKRIYDENVYAPMLDRTASGYPPGSVYKVVTALAALDIGLIDGGTRFECKGFYEFARRRFRCHRRSGHGVVELHDAIVRSCDVYFYRVAELMGMERLYHYGHDVFGLGQPTGVETWESRGWIPSRKAYFRKRPDLPFKPGWTLSTAVGQGNVLTTPLQMAQLYAGIANGGKVPVLHLVERIEDAEGTVLMRKEPRVATTLPFAPEAMERVRKALYDTVQSDEGTARAIAEALSDLKPAGKTGTAEAPEHRKGASGSFKRWLLRDHAWFVGYAPAEHPEIVVVVLLEHGGSGGREAAPIFARIVRAIFDRRLNLPGPHAR